LRHFIGVVTRGSLEKSIFTVWQLVNRYLKLGVEKVRGDLK